MNASFDPYKELGLPRNADKAQIRKAYRNRSKDTHPDTGGDAEAFAAANRALTVLLDPKKRQRFDQTGEIDDGSAAQSEWHDALTLIMPMISGGVLAWARDAATTQDLEQHPIFAQLHGHISAERAKQLAEVDVNQRIVDKLRKLARRTRRKDGLESQLARSLEGEAQRAEMVAEKMNQSLARFDKALELLDAHAFDTADAPAGFTGL